MNRPIPECPVCRVRMQEGVVYYSGDKGSLGRGKWAEGTPEKGLLGGYKTKGRQQCETVTFRCPSCGWLIWFAPPSTKADD